jgi:hypothetical protein
MGITNSKEEEREREREKIDVTRKELIKIK